MDRTVREAGGEQSPEGCGAPRLTVWGRRLQVDGGVGCKGPAGKSLGLCSESRVGAGLKISSQSKDVRRPSEPLRGLLVFF